MSFLQSQSVVQRICVLKKYLIYRDFQEWIENRFPLQSQDDEGQTTGKPRWNAFQRGFPVGFSAVSGANSGAFSVKTGVPEVSRIGIATLFRGQLAKNAGHLPFLQTVLLRFPIQNW